MFRKVLILALRDYQAAVRTKAFIISLVMMPVLMLGGVGVQFLMRDVKDLTPQNVIVLDASGGELGELLKTRAEAQPTHDPSTRRQVRPRLIVTPRKVESLESDEAAASRLALSEQVRKGQLLAFVEIGPNVYQTAAAVNDEQMPVRYYSNRPTVMTFVAWMQGVLNERVQEKRLRDAGIDRAKVTELTRPVQLSSRGLITLDKGTGKAQAGKAEDRVLAFVIPAMMVALMFMMVMIGTSPLLQSVVEEKTLRIAEVLLGSVTPFQLMLGKLLGTVGVSLTLAGFYLGGAYLALWRMGLGDKVPVPLLASFLLFLVLGVLMYGSIFIAVGAACTDLRETQTLLMPVMLVIVMPMFMLGHFIESPNGPLARSMSYFPLSTPMLMILRQGVPPGLAWWELVLGVVTVCLGTLGCVWAAGRVFRVGILVQGKGASVRQILRWIVKG